jgi:aspartate aminotransferase
VFPPALVEPVTRLAINSVSCTSAFSQYAAIAALEGPWDPVEAMVAEFRRRRDIIVAGLNDIPGITCLEPQGAFYAFPDISVAFGKSHEGTKISNDVEFCAALLEATGVACVPGSAFGEPRAMRISYTCPTAQLKPGLERIQAFFESLKGIGNGE